MFLKKLGQVELPPENQTLDFINKHFVPEFINVSRQPVHQERLILRDGAELITLRDLNDGYTFKGNFLLRCFPNWEQIYQSIVKVAGPMSYALPHVVLHRHDLPIHVDRRFFSVNIGLVHPDRWETQVLSQDKSRVVESARYTYGEFIGLDTREFHTVVGVVPNAMLHGFLVFTPKNDIAGLLQ